MENKSSSLFSQYLQINSISLLAQHILNQKKKNPNYLELDLTDN